MRETSLQSVCHGHPFRLCASSAHLTIGRRQGIKEGRRGGQLIPQTHSLFLQGNGTADGYGNFVGTGTLDSYDGYFQGSGTFAGTGDCEGSQVYSS